MSKRIVFLYCNQKNKNQLMLCERVLRAVLRKFRKSALFSYVQIDSSPSCRELMRDLLIKETSRTSAVFMESDTRSISSYEEFTKDIFGICSVQHHIAGRVICYPEQEHTVQSSDENITHSVICTKENIRKAALLSLKSAKERKRSLTICLKSKCNGDELFLREAEYATVKEKHIDTCHISLDEMISLCMKTIPAFDVVLTLKEYASIISMHLNSLPSVSTGFIVNHSENVRIYKRQILPCEEVSNASMVSALLAFAAILEHEFNMKNASVWLRRAISLAFEKGAYDAPEDFVSRLIAEINTPIRKRRTE